MRTREDKVEITPGVHMSDNGRGHISNLEVEGHGRISRSAI